MTQDEAVQQAQSGVSSTLQVLWQAGYDEGKASVPAPAPIVGADADEQTKIDAAVAQAVGPLQGQIAALQAAGVEAQAKLDAETALEVADQGTITSLRAVLTQIAALAAPAPAPAAAPAQA